VFFVFHFIKNKKKARHFVKQNAEQELEAFFARQLLCFFFALFFFVYKKNQEKLQKP